MKALLLAALIATFPSCVVLDVVEGFRQFGGQTPSKYADWRTKQLAKQLAKRP